MHASIPGRALSVLLAALLVFTMLPLVGPAPTAHAAIPPANVDYHSVDFVDDTWGWVAGSNGTILRTRNGGDNWEVLQTGTTETFVAVSFVDRDRGWALTRSLWVHRTTDAGETWTRMGAVRHRSVPISGNGDALGYDLHFIDQNTGFLVARAYPEGSGHADIMGLVFRSTDGGVTWSRVLEGPDHRTAGQTYPFDGRSVLRAVDFVSSSHGWVVGVDQYVGRKPVVYRTTTGGGTGSWTEAGSGITGTADLYGVSFATQSIGLVVGERLRWDTSTSPARWVSDGGAIYRSANGGATWTAQTSGATSRLNDVFMLDTLNAWAVGDNNTIRRSTNGGTTWTTGWAESGSGTSWRSVQVRNVASKSGWLVGSGGRIRIVDTGGTNWWRPVPDLEGPSVSGLTSSTHPDQSAWYGTTAGTPRFAWAESSDRSGVDGYQVSFGPESQAPVYEKYLKGSGNTTWEVPGPLSDGVWNLTVTAKDGVDNWGDPASYTVRYDGTTPSDVTLSINGGADATNSRDVQAAVGVGQWGPSGSGQIRVSVDAGASWTAWEGFAGLIDLTLPAGDGVKSVAAQVRDGAGNVSANVSDWIVLDTAAPTGSVSINGGAEFTGSAVVVVSSDVDFGPSGPGMMRFSTDGGSNWTDPEPYSEDRGLTLPGDDGEKTVGARFSDGAGNWSDTITDTIMLDTTMPSVTDLASPSHPVSSQWYAGRDVSLTWHGESSSDITGYSYSWSQDPSVVPDMEQDTTEANLQLPGVGDGVWYFKVRARNSLEVWGDFASRTVRIDGTPPAIASMVVNEGQNATRSRTIGVETQVQWGASGANQIRTSVDGGSTWGGWISFASPVQVTLPDSDGQHTVAVEVRDRANNESVTATRVIVLDRQAPVADTVVVNGGNEFSRVRTVALASEVEWGPSGAGSVEFSLDGGSTWSSPVPYSSPIMLQLTGADGVKQVRARFIDAAGNVSAPPHRGADVTLDTTSPTASSVAINGGATSTSSATVQLTSTVNWGVSGAHPTEAMRVSVTGGSTWGAWRPHVSPLSATLPAGAGDKHVWVEFRDAAGNTSATVKRTITLLSLANETPIAGSNRYDTAVLGSREAYPNGLSTTGKRTVVIATGQNWPDALGGSALAGAVDGPILLVEPGSVPAAVSRELTRLGARNAIIVGGEAAVSRAVMTALDRQLPGKVERISGSNRYQTADRIATRVIAELGSSYDGRAFVATGGNFPDALAAAPLAAANGWPLFLSDPDTGRLPASSLSAMRPKVKNVVILGGTAVVPAGVEATLKNTFGQKSVTRIAGAGRYDTARQVAAYGVANSDLSWGRVGISTGTNFPDALAGGVLMGKVGGVVLLTESHRLSGETSSALSANRSRIMNVTYFGGTSAVSETVRSQVRSALRW